MGYTEQYDKPAQAYEDRLASASMAEEQRAEEMWRRTRQDTEQQHAQQTNMAYGSLAGAGANQGTMGLRSAAYAGGQMGQQYHNDSAMLAATEDQAYRQQMMQVLGRRGDYGMQGMGFAADQYGAAQQAEAYARMQEEQQKLRDAQEVTETVGLVAGIASGGMMGGM